MTKYTSISKPVDAMQWTGVNWGDLKAWFGTLETDGPAALTPIGDGVLVLKTVFMETSIQTSDWLICNANGMVFMANDEAFQENYVFSEETLDPNGGSHEKPLGE